TIPERFGFGSPLGNGVNFHEKRGKGTSLISTVSEGKERDFLRCGGQARTVSPVDVTAVRGSQLTYCVEVAAELLADVEEQTVRSVHQAQRPGRESPDSGSIKPGSETVNNPDPDSFRPQNPQQTRPQPPVERGWADTADSRPPLRGARWLGGRLVRLAC